jgi:hypothetical protein
LVRFDGDGVHGARLDWGRMRWASFHRDRMGVFRNMNRIVTGRFDGIPISGFAGRQISILSELILVTDSRLLRLSPPGGLAGRLRLADIALRIVLAGRELRGTVAKIAIVRRRRSIVRICGRPRVGLSSERLGIPMLPDDHE